jgi:hypothetical protein
MTQQVIVDGVEPALPVDRVVFTGSLAHLSVWCRQDSPARTESRVPWDTSVFYPWVVEVHGWWPDSGGGDPFGLIVAVPCAVDPRVSGNQADAAIRWAVTRALLHEAQECTVIDGQRRDPHEHGEFGAEVMGLMLGAWPLTGNATAAGEVA